MFFIGRYIVQSDITISVPFSYCKGQTTLISMGRNSTRLELGLAMMAKGAAGNKS
jgi:hypothetical protein